MGKYCLILFFLSNYIKDEFTEVEDFTQAGDCTIMTRQTEAGDFTQADFTQAEDFTFTSRSNSHTTDEADYDGLMNTKSFREEADVLIRSTTLLLSEAKDEAGGLINSTHSFINDVVHSFFSTENYSAEEY